MHRTDALRWLVCAALTACTGTAPPDVATKPVTPVTPAAVEAPATPAVIEAPAKPATPAVAEKPAEVPAIPVPPDPPAEPSEAPPQKVPETRPRTIEEARTHMLAISADRDLSKLAALADPKRGLEFVYRSEGKRARRSKLPLDPTALAAEFGEREPWRPQQYVSSFTAEYEPGSIKLDAARLTVVYEPDAAFGIDFIFKKQGEELVLAQISAWDQEP